ncbi:MAG: helix-turn-helix domain-containing protein [Sedimenticola sp.]
MPKKYVHTKRGKTLNYNPEDLEKAVTAVTEGMSIRKAATTFGVPRATVGDRASGRFETNVQHGRPPCIPKVLEAKMVESVKIAARRGIGLTRKQILVRTNVLCKRSKIGSGYPNFKAGKDWWEGVKRRHPDLTVRKPERLSSVRARMMNREVLNKYFDDLGRVVEELNIKDKPKNIWNCDEMGKSFEHDPVRIVTEKGERNCLARTSSRSTNITVMACVNAVGRRMPPMFIVKGKTSKSLHGFNTTEAPIGSRWYYQDNGWMTDSIGEKWFNEVFLQFCGTERPQLLILDGHSSHETLAILQRALEENIHILALPPHTTHYLQPLDRAVFGPLNRYYNEECSEYIRNSSLHQINKWTFPTLFRKSWDKGVTSVNIRSGFRACGIYPFNPHAVPGSAVEPSEPTNRPAAPITPTTSDDAAECSVNDLLSDAGDMPVATVEIASGMAFSPSTSLPTDLPVTTIIDISNPAELLKLIETGDIIITPDNNDSTTPSIDHTADPTYAVPIVSTNETLLREIEEVFLPNSSMLEPPKKKRNAVKKHRLLTSDAIVREKLNVAKAKKEKEQKKNARALAKKLSIAK